MTMPGGTANSAKEVPFSRLIHDYIISLRTWIGTDDLTGIANQVLPNL